MPLSNRLPVWVIGAIVVLAVAPWGGAQQTSGDEERELREMVEALKDRISELEQRLDKLSESKAEQEPKASARPEGALDIYWKEGIRIDSAEANEDGKKPFQLKLGGRIQNDWGWFSGDDDLKTVGNISDGTEFRRTRISLGGVIYENYEFKVQFDFADGDTDFNDVYIAAKGVPWSKDSAIVHKVGHFKEPASLEALTSSKDATFMERGLPVIFTPGRNTGFGAFNHVLGDRMTYAAGIFRNTNSFGDGTGGDEYGFTGRVTGLALHSGDGRQLIHLGGWASYRNADRENFRILQRPEAHLVDPLIDTFDQIGMMDNRILFGAEMAGVWGPASLQAEYMRTEIDRPVGGDVAFDGFYVYASYFITGEHRRYKTSAGVFDKIRPKKNFSMGENTGPGAWEVALRYSHLDLDDENVFGGDEDNITVGVNWYLNANMKIQLNYVHAMIEREETVVVDAGTPDEQTFGPVDGNVDGFLTRFQVTW